MLSLSYGRNVGVIGISVTLGSSTRAAILFVPFSARLIVVLANCVIIDTLPMSWKRDVKWFHSCILALRSTFLISSDSQCYRLKVLRYRSSNCWMISTARSTTPYHVTTSTRYDRFIVTCESWTWSRMFKSKSNVLMKTSWHISIFRVRPPLSRHLKKFLCHDSCHHV